MLSVKHFILEAIKGIDQEFRFYNSNKTKAQISFRAALSQKQTVGLTPYF